MNCDVVCIDCGLPYSEMGLDLVLPDQQWKRLFPEETGVLCANCICRRAAKLGGTVVLAWIDRMDYEKQIEKNPYPMVIRGEWEK